MQCKGGMLATRFHLFHKTTQSSSLWHSLLLLLVLKDVRAGKRGCDHAEQPQAGFPA